MSIRSSRHRRAVQHGNSFEGVRGMRTLPITRDTVVQLVATTLLPVVPLLLTMISPEDLFKRFLKIVF
jgi:hypothetical protein